MSSIVRINGDILKVDCIDAEGRIFARLTGSGTRFECPLALYLKGTGIPSSVESTKIMKRDEDATFPDSGNYVECTGCNMKVVARAQRDAPQSLLRDWTIHKLTCKVLQSRLRDRSIGEGRDSDSDADADAVHAQPTGRGRTSTRSESSARDIRKGARTNQSAIADRIDFLLKLRDIESVNKSKHTVFCIPCNKDYCVGPIFQIGLFIRHSRTHKHQANGGIELKAEEPDIDLQQREVSPRRFASKASLGAFRRKRRSYPRQRSPSEPARQNNLVPADANGAPSVERARARGACRPHTEETAEARLQVHDQVVQASDHQKVTAVLNLPADMPRPARIEVHGTVTF
ncbi:hypothetical protein SCHPADRAFT_943550 [Schizopora paradoxa]|uniref:Uncharacterized protein n=1 Tax=Schizopora paradoxa TaxID=27342 RepID=A0A0H2RDG3_9AGAM|nr:hypothetical protein SCHPADRAFT_943550 [Schizopora paradoxa]